MKKYPMSFFTHQIKPVCPECQESQAVLDKKVAPFEINDKVGVSLKCTNCNYYWPVIVEVIKDDDI